MKKIKLLFAAALLLCTAGAWAQTDVTSTYLVNPSFETDGSISASNGALTITGWIQSDPTSSYNNTGCYDASTNLPTQGTVTVTPSNGDYLLFFRKGWAQNTYTFTTAEPKNLPDGIYSLSVDYKMVEGYDDKQNNNTTVTISAKNGEDILGTETGTTKTNVKSSNAYTYLNTADWNTITANFTLENATSTTFVIALKAGGQRRSDFVVDNVRLLYTEFIRPEAISLNESSLDMKLTQVSTLSVTSYTPATVNKDTEISWESDTPDVVSVNESGVVTAVSLGTANITAKTPNGVSATCSVTVTDVTAAAAPTYYSDIAAGEYFYIVNAATGKFLGGGNSWGTQASLIDHGIPFTIAETDGKYTLDSHTYNSESQHFLNGTYVDGNATDLYITSLGSGKYSISTANGSAFITANVNNTTVANTASNADSPLAQWYFVSKDNRDDLFASATDASPVEATYYIPNASFSRNMNTEYNEKRWSVTASNSNLASDANCAESWHSTFNVTQTISLPNGKYTFRAQGFHSGSRAPYFFVGDETIPFPAQTGSEASMSAAAASFLAGEYYTEYATVYVTNGSLTLGCKLESGTDDWCIWDNFELRYHGPIIGGEATEIPMDTKTAMTADKWYYFDIPVNGLYNLTTTTLSNIVYTTDGTILIEDESDVTNNFSKAENETLSAGRYFIKSSTAQNLEVTVGAYSYAVGSPTFSTVDGGYTQSSTFTVTFTSASTNDPSGEIALVASSKGTVNGDEVDLSAVTNGFSLDLGSLTANTAYRIVIPAEVYGYSGESMNEEIDITIHTPAAFDGFYFLRTSAGKYVARGGDYNSRAVVDEFGLPLSVATNAAGVTQFTYVDNGGKLFLNGSGNAYTDNDTDPDWTFEATEGGYYLVHANGTYANKKLNVWSGDSKSLYATETEGAVFVIEPVSEHNTYMEALKDAQAATAATAYGNDAITTKAELATWLAANYDAVPVSVPSVSFTEKWNGDASAEWGTGKDMYTNTISSLPEGLYKLTVNAYYRINGSATAAEGARGNTYLYGGSAKTQLYSLKDFPAAEAWSGRNQNDAAGYYPDDVTSGTAATASTYLTELYVYHTGGDFTYGIHQPSRFSNGQWFGYQNFTLTRYEINIDENADYTPVSAFGTVTLARTIKANTWNTFVVPFALNYDELKDAFGSDVEVAEFSDSGESSDAVTVSFTKMGTPAITANTPVLLKTSTAGTSYSFPGRTVVAGTPAVTGKYLDFVGTYTASTTIDSGDFFISGNKLYKSSGATTIQGTRAYLHDKSGAGVKAMLFIDDEATSIDAINGVEAENGVIYNIAGQRLNKVQKGINIVNGKKVLY